MAIVYYQSHINTNNNSWYYPNYKNVCYRLVTKKFSISGKGVTRGKILLTMTITDKYNVFSQKMPRDSKGYKRNHVFQE